MLRLRSTAAGLFLLAIVSGGAPAAEPVTGFAELAKAIFACWKPPSGSQGSEITLRFGLTGRGALRGTPMVTYSRLLGPEDAQRAFALSALRAVADCTPVNLSEAFGPVVAQRVITLRFAAKAKQRPPI